MIEDEDDRQFMERVYAQYHPLMYAQALRILRQSQAAEDAVSDSLIALIKKIDLLRTLECNKLKAYVVITVKHTALSQEYRRRRETLPGDEALELLPDPSKTEGRLLERAGVERVKNAVCALPPREKDVMLMKYFREMTDEEIARETGLKPVSVRVHLSRARKRLSQLLSGEEE